MNDRLTPILVKELRQGIRSQVFTGAFLLVQALLFLFGLSFLLSEALQKDSTAGGAFFWTMLVLPLLVLVPAPASQAIEKEITGKTLELLLLTRLSSYRIVLGKWASIVLQATLLLVSALPYVFLRYFLGGIDLFSELRALGSLLVGAALLAGVSLGFGTANVSRVVKWGAVLALLWVSPVFTMMLLSPHGGFGFPPGMGSLIWIFTAILMLMMVEAAAARIGPPSANHRSRLRLLALLALVVPFFYEGRTAAVAAVVALFFVVPMVVGSLGENARALPRLYAPFLRGRLLRRVAFFPFSPSWPGGIAFTVLVLSVAPFLPPWRGEIRPIVWVAIAGTLLVPAALVRGVFRPSRPLAVYLVILVVSSLPVYVYLFAEGTALSGISANLQAIAGLSAPLAAVVELVHPEGYAFASLARATLLVVTAGSLLVTILTARREWARIAATVRETGVSPS